MKHIFCDMDGTLLDNDCQLSEENADFVRELEVPFTLVSARAPMEMYDFVRRLNLSSEQIAFNGGLIFRKSKDSHKEWEIIESNIIPREAAEEVIDYIKENFPQLSLSFYDQDKWFAEATDDMIQYNERVTNCQAIISPFESSLAQAGDIYKIMVSSNEESEILLLQEALSQLAYPELSFLRSNANYLEITSVKAQKSRGISYVMEKEKITKEGTVAFGDGPNDAPMLEMVEMPIAMANAVDELKTIAKYITKSNEENGVAFAIEKFLE